MKINIELKVLDIEKNVLSMVKKRNMISDVIVSSFLHGTLASLRSLDTKISTAVLVSKINDETISYVKELQANALNPDFKLIQSTLVTEAHMNHIQIFPWTVNEPEDMEKLYRMDVDGVITNFPDTALNVLEKIMI
jgi:glycerophosphoryl diester phosphodiesterase